MTTRKHAFYGILVLVGVLTLGITQSARANFIATINQVGTNVVVTGSGTIDLTGLTFFGNTPSTPFMEPDFGALTVGLFPIADVSVFAPISGPASFGTGGNIIASSGSGDAAGIFGTSGVLLVPLGYISGNPLSGTATYDNATFPSLGLTPGTYTWTWGTGMHADSFTLQIGPAGVPDAGSTLGLLLVALGGLFGVSRFRLCSLGLTKRDKPRQGAAAQIELLRAVS
jgi:hypothetical protein